MSQRTSLGESTGWVHSTLADDPDFADILPLFIDELPGIRAVVNDAARSNDFDSLRREAHKLRGSAGGYGFSGLSTLAGKLEDSCKNSAEDETMVLRNVNELLDYLDRVRI